MNNLYGLSSKKYTNFEDIRSSFVCESTKNLCGINILIRLGKNFKYLYLS